MKRWRLVLVVAACASLFLIVALGIVSTGQRSPTATNVRYASSISAVSSAKTQLKSWLSSDPDFSQVPSSKALYKSLTPRLKRLLSQSIAPYETALARSVVECPTAHLQSNQDQLHGNLEAWANFTSMELEDQRKQVADAVMVGLGFAAFDQQVKGTSMSESNWSKLFGQGRGLVTTAGKYVASSSRAALATNSCYSFCSKDTIKRLVTGLTLLRQRHLCGLSVEIFGFAAEFDQIEARDREALTMLGNVTFRTIELTRRREGQWKSFEIVSPTTPSAPPC